MGTGGVFLEFRLVLPSLWIFHYIWSSLVMVLGGVIFTMLIDFRVRFGSISPLSCNQPVSASLLSIFSFHISWE